MGFVLKYCDECHKRIPEEDFSSGDAVESDGHTYCKLHVPENFKEKTAKVKTPSKKISKARIQSRKYQTTHIRRVIDSASETSKRRSTLSNRNRELRARKESQEKAQRKQSGKIYPIVDSQLRDSGKRVIPFIPIIGLLIVVGVILFFVFAGSDDIAEDNVVNDLHKANSDDVKNASGNADTTEPKKSRTEYQQWIEGFEKISKDYTTVINNPETEESAESIEILAYKDYRIALKLQKALENKDLARIIPRENVKNLIKKFIPGLGESAAGAKCKAVLDKTNKLLSDLDYENAVQYLDDVLAGKIEADFPKLLLNKSLLCYRKMNNKFNEISSIFEKNREMIAVSKDFMQIEADLYGFYEDKYSDEPSENDWELAREYIQRILDFKEQNIHAYENTKSRFAVKTRIDYSVAELLKFGYFFHMNLIEEVINKGEADKIKKLIAEIEKDKEFLDWLETYSHGYHSNIVGKIEKIQAEFQKEIDANFDLIPVLKRIFAENLITINNFLSNNIELETEKFDTSTTITLPVISKLFESLWIAQVVEKDQLATLQNIADKVEQKIFTWFYKTQTIINFRSKNYYESWCAFGNVLKLLWKPEDSRFGTNLIKLVENYQDNFTQENYLKTYDYLKILCKTEDKEYSISSAVSKLWDVVWDFFQAGKSLLVDIVKKQLEPLDDFMTAYHNCLVHSRIIVISISQKRKFVANADIALSMVGKTKTLLDWHENFIAEADVTGKNTKEAENFHKTLSQFLEYLKNY